MKTEQSGDRKVGEATKEDIEDNREVQNKWKKLEQGSLTQMLEWTFIMYWQQPRLL